MFNLKLERVGFVVDKVALKKAPSPSVYHLPVLFHQCSMLIHSHVSYRLYITSAIDSVVKLHARYRVILSVLDPRKCEYLKDYSLDFEHAYMTTYLAS